MREFHAPRCGITDVGPLSVQHITEAMRKNRGMKILNLSYNHILNRGAVNLTELIRTTKSLETLDLSHNSISGEGIVPISDALKVIYNQLILTLN